VSTEMNAYRVNVCRHCSQAFRSDGMALRQRLLVPLFHPFPARSISGMPKPQLQIPPPDPNAPRVEVIYPPPRHDPGVTLGEHGIPVPPTPQRRYPEDKAWAETVFRTLSGGTKSEYLKCIPLLNCSSLTTGTELDEHGNVRVGMQAFKKMELCTMVS